MATICPPTYKSLIHLRDKGGQLTRRPIRGQAGDLYGRARYGLVITRNLRAAAMIVRATETASVDADIAGAGAGCRLIPLGGTGGRSRRARPSSEGRSRRPTRQVCACSEP